MSSNRSSRPEILMRDARERRNAIRILAFPTKPLPFSMLLTFRKYDYKRLYNQIENPQNTNSAPVELESTIVIELPFPSNLTDATGLRLENFGRSIAAQAIGELVSGATGSSGAEILASIKGAGTAASEKLQDVGGGLVTSDKESRQGLTAMLSYITSLLGKNSFSQTVESTVGLTVNPKETMAFSGVDLKAHSFQWKLFPSNRKDSEAIREISRAIKQSVLPSTRNVIGLEKMFLSYPSTVEIELIGVDTKYFMKFKPAMVSSFNVSYGSGEGIPLLSGGKPASVTFDLELTELEADESGDYGGEFDSSNLAGSIDTVANND